MNATEQMNAQELERKKDILSERFACFVERWLPRTRDDVRDFERDLHYLIHLTYEQAQAPFVKEYSMMRDVMLSKPFVSTEKPNQL